jgi:hypothetical protein
MNNIIESMILSDQAIAVLSILNADEIYSFNLMESIILIPHHKIIISMILTPMHIQFDFFIVFALMIAYLIEMFLL